MPKQIADIKKFLVYAKRKDAREIRVKKNTNETKFKLRCSRYLYTLKVSDAKKAEKLRKAFPANMKIVDIKN